MLTKEVTKFTKEVTKLNKEVTKLITKNEDHLK